ncbi:hypothetical protein [Orenia marismortui]|uniref:hypothetical protein n=1 Tax=Orenia marismortui TaxID=46469 RepID=UPI00037A98A6|nr:hypothetical protein [Orenia marismortui]
MLSKFLKYQQGSALLVAIIVMFFVGIIGFALSTFVASEIKSVDVDSNVKEARYVARSGAAAMVAWIEDHNLADMIGNFGGLADGRTTAWTDFESNSNLSKQYRVNVTMNDDNNSIDITSEGRVGRINDASDFNTLARETIRVSYGQPTGTSGVADLDRSIFAMDRLVFDGDVMIPGDITVNGGFLINQSSVLEGDNFQLGETDGRYNSSIRNSVSLTGRTDILMGLAEDNIDQNVRDDIDAMIDSVDVKRETLEVINPYTLPAFPVYPTDLDNRGDLEIDNDTPTSALTIDVDGEYDNITIADGETLTIEVANQDRIIRVDNLIIEDGNIVINKADGSDAKVNLYVNNLQFVNEDPANDDSTINSGIGANSDNLIIYHNGLQTLRVSGRQRINAHVYVQQANIFLNSIHSIFGDIVSGGDNITLECAVVVDPSALSRAIYAPKSIINLSTVGNIRPQTHLGVIVGQEVRVGPHFNVDLFRTNTYEILGGEADFQGGRVYQNPLWEEGN